MCTYDTVLADLGASVKGPATDWFTTTRLAVYYDHPAHAMAEHALCIDLSDPSRGAGQRVGIELTADAARELVRTIEAALVAVPPELR